MVSHHIGYFEHLATYQLFLQAIDHLRGLYDVTPEIVAHDLHPEYLSTKLAMDLDLPTVVVQHHHAHVALALHRARPSGTVLGLAFDGLGYGADGTLWGGELLVADLQGFERVGHLAAITMPGGAAAIREPWRMGVAWAHEAGVDDLFEDERRSAVLDLVERGHGPVTSSMGRLFDAVAALLGMRPVVSYEAQAAIELEALARSVPRPRHRPTQWRSGVTTVESSSSIPARWRPARARSGARHGAGGRGGGVPRVDRPRLWPKPPSGSPPSRASPQWPSPVVCSRTCG